MNDELVIKYNDLLYWDQLVNDVSLTSPPKCKHLKIIADGEVDIARLRAIFLERFEYEILELVNFKATSIPNIPPGKKIIFRACVFKTIEGYASTAEKLFIDCVDFSINNQNFGLRKATFLNCKNISVRFHSFLGVAVFNNCSFNSLHLSGQCNNLEIINSVYNCIIFCDNVTFNSNVYLGETNCFAIHSQEAESNYRALKACFSAIHNSSEEIIFYGHELKSKYGNHNNSGYFIKIFASLYKMINDFGLQIFRPVIWILAGSIIFTLFNILIFKYYSVSPITIDKNCLFLKYFVYYLFYPIMHFAFASSDEKTSLWHAVFALEAFIQTILYFFLILGIRKKFKID